jgi:hypothetical protein
MKDRVVKPKFTRHLKDLLVPESTNAHFEATLIPVGMMSFEFELEFAFNFNFNAGDPFMEVWWEHDGKKLEPAARIKTTYDFGFCVLDINGVEVEDEGLYECKARNK